MKARVTEMAREISDGGRAVLQEFEGLSLKAYQDVVGIWTIGYGHTGKDVVPGLVIDLEQAEALLDRDLCEVYDALDHFVDVVLTRNQFDALCCFTYNVGVEAFRGSTLLKLLNNSDFSGAAVQFGRWNKAKGKVVDGLTKRRKAESELFLKED